MRKFKLSAGIVTSLCVIVACGSDQRGQGAEENDGGSDGGSETGTHDGGSEPAPIYTVGGAVRGLDGTGLVLQNNAGDDLPVAKDGSFVFSKKAASGASFAITIKTQPSAPTQTCSVSGGTGTIAQGNVTSVTVNCTTDEFTVGGNASGLRGAGLILQNGGKDDLVVAANGTFSFGDTVASGSNYAVTVKAQPGTPSQTCVVTKGAGVVAATKITDVAVVCTTDKFKIGGTVAGLAGKNFGLRLNDGPALPVTGDAFTFPTSLESGTDFAVTIDTQPNEPTQTCEIAGGTGTVVAADVASVAVNCITNKYTVGGVATGLLGSATLRLNGTNDRVVTGNGTFAFSTPLASGTPYTATVFAQPQVPSQTCTISNGTGNVVASAVADIALNCVTNKFSVKATVSGLAGAGLKLKNNSGDELSVNASGVVTFSRPIDSGQTYAVTVSAQPTGPSQQCVVTNPTGTVGAADVTNVSVQCTTSSFTVGGAVSGLAGAGLELQNNLGDDLAVPAGATAFTFPTRVLSGRNYGVTIKKQPTNPSQTCSVVAGTGTVTNGNVVSVAINCTTDKFTVGGTLSGLVGTGLVLQNNLVNDLTLNGGATFGFGVPIASGQRYSVTVKTQPTVPSQTCTVANGDGTVGGGPVTNVAITCTTNRYDVGGTVTGLTSGTLVLANNGGDDRSVTADGPFTFATKIASQGTYAVTVKTQPPNHVCTVVSGSGTIGSANITSVAVQCKRFYSPSGVQYNVPSADLHGWTQCYLDKYDDTNGQLAQLILAACTKPNILMACRRVGSPTLQIAAYAPRVDAFFDTNLSNTPHDANGVGWYFATNSSMGFAPQGDPLNRRPADTFPGAGRLSWHTIPSMSRGYRCGDNTFLNYDPNWERLVYHAD